jgi:mannose-6-phosphate isomerase-like protein (cupin superfamily)
MPCAPAWVGENLQNPLPYPRIATVENPARNSGRTSCPSLTRSQQRTKSKALIEKEATMTIVADSKTYAEILRDIPVFSGCAPEVLDRFVTETVFTVHTRAGQQICARTDASDNLYVVVAGSATLDAGDVYVALEPGDYFGGAGRHHDTLRGSVVADDDVEVLVISPEEIVRLRHAASRRHHPSNADWTPEVTTPNLRLLPSRRRLAALAHSGS